MTRRLPDRPNLAHLKKQAKQLLRGLESRNPQAIERYRAALSRPAPDDPSLVDAQHALALEYGFTSWPKLKAYVEGIGTSADPAAALVAAVTGKQGTTLAWSRRCWRRGRKHRRSPEIWK